MKNIEERHFTNQGITYGTTVYTKNLKLKLGKVVEIHPTGSYVIVGNGGTVWHDLSGLVREIKVND